MLIKRQAKRQISSFYLRFAALKRRFYYIFSDLFLGKKQKVESLRYVPKPLVISLMKSLHANIGENCDIECGISYHNCTDLSKLWIGNDVHIGKNCLIDLRDKVVIRDRCTISMGTTLLTHTDMGKSELSKFYLPGHQQVVIEEDVYIGANSTILMGSVVGNNTIVAAGSLVRGTLASSSVYAGMPAKRIGSVKTDNNCNKTNKE